MADLTALRAALAEQITAIVQRHDADARALTGDDRYLDTSTVELDQINPPIAVVGLGAGALDEGFFGAGPGMDRIALKAIVYVDRDGVEGSQHGLDRYLSSSGPSSIVAAVGANRKLGGACDRIVITGWGEPGVADVGGISYLAVEIDFVALCSP